jgi:hypothetical protein
MPSTETSISFDGAQEFQIEGGNFGTVRGNTITVNGPASPGTISRFLDLTLQSRQSRAQTTTQTSPSTRRRRAAEDATFPPAFSSTAARSNASASVQDSSSSDGDHNSRSAMPLPFMAEEHDRSVFTTPIPPPRLNFSQLPAAPLFPMENSPSEPQRLVLDSNRPQAFTGPVFASQVYSH